MKAGKISIARVSLWVLAIQLAIVSSIAAKYLYQRWTCPRVWVKSMVYDPELLMRGRYLSLQVTVDGCQNALPAANADLPRDASGAPVGPQPVDFPARLKVQGGRLVAIRIPEEDNESGAQTVSAQPGVNCAEMRLDMPVDFYIAEHAADPSPVKRGQELWVEVTVPPKGPPRPVQLALKDNGVWKPLAFQ
jgi:uncharacterized membrane-anchored protein